MLNTVFFLLILLSVFSAFFNNSFTNLATGVFDGIQKAAEFIIKLTAVMCFWSGMLNIAEESGLTKLIGKILSPVLRLIFPSLKRDDKAFEYITMNISANLLGLGNAATPIGLKAMSELNKNNPLKERATNEMVSLVVMNTACITILPTTVAMIRRDAGSNAPMEILPCAVMVSVVSLTVALIAVKIINYAENHRLKKKR